MGWYEDLSLCCPGSCVLAQEPFEVAIAGDRMPAWGLEYQSSSRNLS